MYDYWLGGHDNFAADRTAALAVSEAAPEAILDHPGTGKLIDFGQPMAVLLVAVLHFISDDDDPPAIVGAIRDALPFVISGLHPAVFNV